MLLSHKALQPIDVIESPIQLKLCPEIALKDILPGTVMILIGLLDSLPPRTLRLFHFYNSTSNYLLYQVATFRTGISVLKIYPQIICTSYWSFGSSSALHQLHIPICAS